MTKTMISARIPEKLNNDLEALSETTRRSKAFLLTEALEYYINCKARLYREIDDAVKDADDNGEYVSEKDMEAWLLSWGTGSELPSPRLRQRNEPDEP